MSRSPAPEVVACRELSLGSHIAISRGAYVHHGIYVGNGLVVHSPYFSGAEIVQRALSRVGEDRYHVTNNCEHFCEWCVRAEQRSYQVDRWLFWPLRTLERATYVAAKLVNRFGRLKPLHA